MEAGKEVCSLVFSKKGAGYYGERKEHLSGFVINIFIFILFYLNYFF